MSKLQIRCWIVALKLLRSMTCELYRWNERTPYWDASFLAAHDTLIAELEDEAEKT